MERIYKDLGNMLYAELLHKVDRLGGQVVSCTTDGFVTDIDNLEELILKEFPEDDSLLQAYRNIRDILSGIPEALEVKTVVNGLIQWTTRGQLSLGDSKVPITAATGYQKDRSNHTNNVKVVEEALVNGNRVLFLQKHLTGALEAYKKGSHVSMQSQQRIFRTIFDCKRLVIKSEHEMLFTEPYNDVSEALLHRTTMMQLKQSVYSEDYTLFVVKQSKNSIDETVKFFVRMVTHLYDYDVPLIVKTNIIQIIQMIDKSFNTDDIFDLFSAYQISKGNVVTKLPVFSKTSEFVLKLYNKINELSLENDMYSNILKAFVVYFDNFSCLPTIVKDKEEQAKEDLIVRLKNTDASKIVISVDSEGNTIIKLTE
ncbi:hypothetical protein HOY80DRAFT_1071307 [Tuber brumale]|nr:hypothetical protein HOY80DRAFT_1071307 [Tuber brumale]